MREWRPWLPLRVRELIDFKHAYRRRTEEIYVVSQRRQLTEVPQNLGWGDNKPIKFIDACDRRFTVPYEWCLTWQVRTRSSRLG